MQTKREYLKTQGITVGVRGRFSGAAKVAIQEAISKGVTFSDPQPVTKKAKYIDRRGGGRELPLLPIFDIMSSYQGGRRKYE